MPIVDTSTDFINMGCILVLNCFLAALNPVLFCLFEIWAAFHKVSIGYYRICNGFIFFGVVPTVIYVVFAVRKGWLLHSSVFGKRPLQKLAITIALCMVLLPFQNQILSAPTNIINSMRLLTLSRHLCDHPSTGRRTAVAARTLGKALGEAGKHNEAVAALLEAMDNDLAHDDIDSLNEDFCILKCVDMHDDLSKDEWTNLCKPMTKRAMVAYNKARNHEGNYQENLSSTSLLLQKLGRRYQSHGDFDEARRYYKISNDLRRLKYGESGYPDCRLAATLANDCRSPQEALALLQTSMARSESYYPNYVPDKELNSPCPTLPFAWMAHGIELYEKIVARLPAESPPRKELASWQRNRTLHEKAHTLLKQNNYAAAEPILLQAQEFDLGNKDGSRAWSIYQNLLGSVELKLKKYNNAEKHYRMALEHDLLPAQQGPRSADVARDLGYLAALKQAQGNLPEADQLFSRALNMYGETLGDFALETRAIEAKVIALNKIEQKYGETAKLLQRTITKAQQKKHSQYAVNEYINRLANFYIERGDYSSAQQQMDKIAELRDDYPSTATLSNLITLRDYYVHQKNNATAKNNI